MQKKKVLILHGWGGSDAPHWQDWLQKQLMFQNYTVRFPHLPNRDFPKFDEWIECVGKEVEQFSPDIVVCHSLANVVWFHLLQRIDINPIEKLLLVAPVRKDCVIEELADFFPYTVPKDLKAKKALLIVSTNDVYMNLHEANELQHALNIQMDILENAGHINAESGHGPLQEAVEWINE